MLSKLYKLITYLALIIFLLCPNFSLAADEALNFKDVPDGDWSAAYIYKLKFLGIIEGNKDNTFGYNKNVSRAEFLTMLIKILGQDSSDDTPCQVFNDVPMSSWFFPYIDNAFKQGIIVREEYYHNYFNPKSNITRQEMAVMIVRALKGEALASLAKNADSGFSDVSEYRGHILIAKSYGIINGKTASSFKPLEPALKQETAAVMVRLLDILYKSGKYPMIITTPVAGHQYKKASIPIEIVFPNNLSSLIEKIEITLDDDKVVKTFTSKPYSGEIDGSSWSRNYHAIKATGYTKDGVKLESFPVTVNLSGNDNDGLNNHRNANKGDYLNGYLSLQSKSALTNKLEPIPSGNRKLFVSNSPENIIPGTKPILFDSGTQEGNFRLMFYHQNQAPAQIAIGIEIENMDSSTLLITENGGTYSGLYGNSVGYTAQENFLKSRLEENKDLSDSNPSVKQKLHIIPPKSKVVILQSSLNSGYIGTYIGDFNSLFSGSYIVRVIYAQPGTAASMLSASNINKLSISDNLHTRGVFSYADFDININASVPDKNICFQLGRAVKSYNTELNIHPEQVGFSQEGIVTNSGHFGELYNVNISNPEDSTLTIALEFRGSTDGYPSFPIFYGSNGHTATIIPSKDTALYLGRQLVIEKTCEKQVKFIFCIPPGMNGPLYVYIIKKAL